MPILLDYASDGAIVGGSIFSSIPDGAVESGAWQVVMPAVVYARRAHTTEQAAAVHGYLGAVGDGRMEFVEPDGQGASEDGSESGDESINDSVSPSRSRVHTRSPSPVGEPSPKRRKLSPARSLVVVLPIAVATDETAHALTIAERATRPLPTTAATTDIEHVYPTRRAALHRDDRPYFCTLCSISFGHPTDVKVHFNGRSGKNGCWALHGQPADVAWDHHASCKISEKDLHVVKRNAGFAITDPEGLRKLDAAIQAGRDFKAALREQNDMQLGSAAGEESLGQEERAEREVSSAAASHVLAQQPSIQQPAKLVEPRSNGLSGGVVAASEGSHVPWISTPTQYPIYNEPAKSVTPKRKVVRAGDETETDVGGRRR